MRAHVSVRQTHAGFTVNVPFNLNEDGMADWRRVFGEHHVTFSFSRRWFRRSRPTTVRIEGDQLTLDEVMSKIVTLIAPGIPVYGWDETVDIC